MQSKMYTSEHKIEVFENVFLLAYTLMFDGLFSSTEPAANLSLRVRSRGFTAKSSPNHKTRSHTKGEMPNLQDV